jgi:hypothetical protein
MGVETPERPWCCVDKQESGANSHSGGGCVRILKIKIKINYYYFFKKK